MLEQGYSLLKIETLNWGNFHGYQTFNLRSEEALPGLLSPPSACAILGVNDSGKSTLIDALMITLLPFENSVKLGVTNDVETGSSGGRTIKDYVLGKHSSSTGHSDKVLTNVYGRAQGCSMICLQFKHNRVPNKFITIGRAWWYQNHTVSETQLAFICYEPLSLSQLCKDGKTPRSVKEFKLHLKDQLSQVQLFETMQSYFTALSGSFGQITRDDLKILNRAFYVKSISNIDQFIRENMLLEHENPHLDRLLENIRNGREIASAIQTCESKILRIQKIIKDLEKLSLLAVQKIEKERKLSVLTLHKDWSDLKNLKIELESKSNELQNIQMKLPDTQHARKTQEQEKELIQSQLAHHDVNVHLQQLNLQIEFLEKDVSRLQNSWNEYAEKAKTFGIKISYEAEKTADLMRSLTSKVTDYDQRLVLLETECENYRQESYDIDRQAKDLREELEHLAKSKTLISRDLYGIKESALLDLGIPRHSLVFVGELIKIKETCRENRRAIESALFPISRNILCHPDYLNDFTKWLDSNGIKSDVTAKRISADELIGKKDIHQLVDSLSDNKIAGKHKQNILSMIELLPENHNPFFNYLWTWLLDTFDYHLVDLKEFKTQQGKFVTHEGLVKTDTRTMRKLKQNFPHSLGWDNQESIDSIGKQLQILNTSYSKSKEMLQTTQKSILEISDRRRFCTDFSSKLYEFADFGSKKKSLREYKESLESLHSKNPDYLKLQNAFEQASQTLKVLQKQESQLEVEINQLNKTINTLSAIIPTKESEVKNSSLYARLVFDLKSEEALVNALNEVDLDLQKKKLRRLDFESLLQEEVSKIDLSMDKTRTIAVTQLETYKNEFDDSNVTYQLPGNKELPLFTKEWDLLLERLAKTELPQAQEKWKKFFDQILVDSVKDTINEIKSKLHEIHSNISSINDVLKLTNFEDLPDEKRYLKIYIQSSTDERIRKFKRKMYEIEKILGPSIRSHIENQSKEVMDTLIPFVDDLQNDTLYRDYVTDVRHHFLFEVHSYSRSLNNEIDNLVEIFSGARRDAKSSAQTTQLAYTLLASCLAYRFKFHDPVAGNETPRILILDEFGGKFDNEKPREIIKFLDQMGFQSILVSPMSKADLLAESISHLILVHKVSATQSKVHSYELTSKQDYVNLLKSAAISNDSLSTQPMN